MADFSKMVSELESKRAAKAEAVEHPPSEPGPARGKPGRKPSAASKRQAWKACTVYLQPETLKRLRRVVMTRKLEELPGATDQSAAIEEALQAWLAKAEKDLG